MGRGRVKNWICWEIFKVLSRRSDLARMSHKFNVWDFQPLLSVGLTTHWMTCACSCKSFKLVKNVVAVLKSELLLCIVYAIALSCILFSWELMQWSLVSGGLKTTFGFKNHQNIRRGGGDKPKFEHCYWRTKRFHSLPNLLTRYQDFCAR